MHGNLSRSYTGCNSNQSETKAPQYIRIKNFFKGNFLFKWLCDRRRGPASAKDAAFPTFSIGSLAEGGSCLLLRDQLFICTNSEILPD